MTDCKLDPTQCVSTWLEISKKLGDIQARVDEIPEIRRKTEKNADAIEAIKEQVAEAQGARSAAKWIVRFMLGAIGLGATWYGISNGT